ncbi:MAG: glycosyltransferase family 9 protein [Nanoarchaeota archaeon]|nr:glycosyltransferase family 9 protein [Nanoarchaeota archaeon]
MGVKLIKFVDKFVGIPYCAILGLFRVFYKKNLPSDVKRILIIQLWGIGETVLTVPAIKALKDKYKVSIEVLCTSRNKDVYFNYKFIDKLHVVDLGVFSLKWFILKNLRKYDIVVDMEEYLNISAIMAYFLGKFRVGYSHGVRAGLYDKKVRYNDKQHISKTFFDLVRLLGIKGNVNMLERLNYSNSDKKKVDSKLKERGISNQFILGIAAGAAESAKCRRWPKENFAELIERALKKKKGAKVILIGADYEKELNQSIINLIKDKKIRMNVFNFAGKISLREAFYLISKCNVFVSNDTGPMHVAAAMDVRTIGLFGPNLPIRFGPLNKKSVSVYRRMVCSPCINVHKGEIPECFKDENGECMKAIKVKDVLEYV